MGRMTKIKINNRRNKHFDLGTVNEDLGFSLFF